MSVRWLEAMGVILVATLLLAGCEQRYVSEAEETTTELNPMMVSVPSGFVADAFEAAGGQNAWKETRNLQFDGIVTFYKPDDSFYLTKQRYEIRPWSDAIEISGREPAGAYDWRFSNGQLDILFSKGLGLRLPIDLGSSCLAEAVLRITTAPVRFLDSSARFDKQENPVRVEGRWYFPISEAGKTSGEAIFYQDRDSRLVDMIRIPCRRATHPLVVRGYDYRQVKKGGSLVPTRIEIFSTGAEGDIQKRLVKIECHIIT